MILISKYCSNFNIVLIYCILDDIVIFGASGYTGQYVIEYVYKAVEQGTDISFETIVFEDKVLLYSIYFPDLKNQIGDKKVKLKWAVAGRSSDKLAKVLMAVSLQHPKFDHASVDMIICDVTNEQSINEMAAQAKVLLNCVGPYRYVKMSKTEFHSL